MGRQSTRRKARAARQPSLATSAGGSHLSEVSAFERRLAAPWIDKSIALVAVMPFVYSISELVRTGDFDIPRIGLLLQLALMVLTMVLRRPPVRVTTNPLFWLLAFVATYWSFLTGPLYEPGAQLAPVWASNSISLLALAVSLWARLSLGRSIGFVPAERTIVTTGAYQYARHPIYSGMFIGVLAIQLEYFSWHNLVIDAVWCSLWIIKTFIEEGFLRHNPAYGRYMQAVKWRWFPGIA